jgi:hypothetical protein
LYQTIDNVATLIPTAISARLAEFVPYKGFPSTLYSAHYKDEAVQAPSNELAVQPYFHHQAKF